MLLPFRDIWKLIMKKHSVRFVLKEELFSRESKDYIQLNH